MSALHSDVSRVGGNTSSSGPWTNRRLYLNYSSGLATLTAVKINFQFTNFLRPGMSVDVNRQSIKCDEKTHPQLAKEVLHLYNRPQNKNKSKVYICGYFLQAKCNHLSISTSNLRSHVVTLTYFWWSKWSTTLEPERELLTNTNTWLTHAKLKKERGNVAQDILKCYYDHEWHSKIHLCGYCDYFSRFSANVRSHVA